MAGLSRPRRRWRDQEPILRDQRGYDASFHVKAETARLFRPRRRRRDQEPILRDQRGYDASFHVKAETARLFRPRRRRRDQDYKQRLYFFQTFTTHVQTFATNFWYFQTFADHGVDQSQTLGATMQFGSKSGCGVTLKVWKWVWDLDPGVQSVPAQNRTKLNVAHPTAILKRSMNSWKTNFLRWLFPMLEPSLIYSCSLPLTVRNWSTWWSTNGLNKK